ncbi:MAG: 6,7-dimethyl-8-ribityllumazine synthase [Alphaproteobacteria bacterium]
MTQAHTHTRVETQKALIVFSPYYTHIAGMLLEGAKTYLQAQNIGFDVLEVPGALEIPLAVKLAHQSGQYGGFIALGCVLRGETSHYDIVCEESARGLSRLGLDFDLPIGNGILTCDTEAQAIVRADPQQKNKGRDAAEAMARLMQIKNQFDKQFDK